MNPIMLLASVLLGALAGNSGLRGIVLAGLGFASGITVALVSVAEVLS